MEVLSEHLCQGWLEGYLLTGRHGLFNCYEAFIHIVDSMFNQHAKWLKVTRQIPWRRPIASLNYLLSSHVWRQDHNGFSHQDPGLHRPRREQEGRGDPRLPAARREHAALGRRPLPAEPRLRQRDRRRASSRRSTTSTMDEAIRHCTRGLGIWEWASNDDGGEPDVVLGLLRRRPDARDARRRAILRERLPELKVRVVNVVDLMRLQPDSEHPHGLSDGDFDSLFTTDRPIVFAYHGYPWLIHRLTYRRHEPPQPARARLQGGGDDDDAVRHGDAERPRPVPPRHRRDRPRPRPRREGRAPAPGDGRPAARRARVHARARRRRSGRSATGPGRSEPRPRRQRGLDEPEALARRRGRRPSRSSPLDDFAAARRGRPPDRARRATSAAGRRSSTTRSSRVDPAREPPLAPLHNRPALAALERRAGGAAGRAARRRLRLRVPPHA